MSMQYEWTGNGIALIKEAVAALSSDRARLVQARAMNHTGDKAFTQVKRAIATETKIPQHVLIERGGLRQRRASTGRLVYDITTSGKPINIKYLGAKPAGRGLSARLYGGTRKYKTAFIGPGALNELAFHRFGKKVLMSKGRYKGKYRQRIQQVVGANINKDLVRNSSKAAFERVLGSDLLPRVHHEISYLTKGVFR